MIIDSLIFNCIEVSSEACNNCSGNGCNEEYDQDGCFTMLCDFCNGRGYLSDYLIKRMFPFTDAEKYDEINTIYNPF